MVNVEAVLGCASHAVIIPNSKGAKACWSEWCCTKDPCVCGGVISGGKGGSVTLGPRCTSHSHGDDVLLVVDLY